MSSYKLAICSIFTPHLYGIDENSTPGIENHYLVMYTIELDEFYNKDYKDYISLLELATTNQIHPTIRNYATISRNIKLDIIKCDELSGLEQVGYIKTFWLKIVQRRWKKVYKERQDLLKARSSIMALNERQLTGRWSKQLSVWPKFTLNLHH